MHVLFNKNKFKTTYWDIKNLLCYKVKDIKLIKQHISDLVIYRLNIIDMLLNKKYVLGKVKYVIVGIKSTRI